MPSPVATWQWWWWWCTNGDEWWLLLFLDTRILVPLKESCTAWQENCTTGENEKKKLVSATNASNSTGNFFSTFLLLFSFLFCFCFLLLLQFPAPPPVSLICQHKESFHWHPLWGVDREGTKQTKRESIEKEKSWWWWNVLIMPMMTMMEIMSSMWTPFLLVVFTVCVCQSFTWSFQISNFSAIRFWLCFIIKIKNVS